jgi:hypothetical protein
MLRCRFHLCPNGFASKYPNRFAFGVGQSLPLKRVETISSAGLDLPGFTQLLDGYSPEGFFAQRLDSATCRRRCWKRTSMLRDRSHVALPLLQCPRKPRDALMLPWNFHCCRQSEMLCFVGLVLRFPIFWGPRSELVHWNNNYYLNPKDLQMPRIDLFRASGFASSLAIHTHKVWATLDLPYSCYTSHSC